MGDIARAVCGSALPSHLRHMLMVMEHLAVDDGGVSGQWAIARATGVSVRTVRRNIAELERCDSPVRIERVRRSAGGPRATDHWRLVLAQTARKEVEHG